LPDRLLGTDPRHETKQAIQQTVRSPAGPGRARYQLAKFQAQPVVDVSRDAFEIRLGQRLTAGRADALTRRLAIGRRDVHPIAHIHRFAAHRDSAPTEVTL
jgi:hypothetical protein